MDAARERWSGWSTLTRIVVVVAVAAVSCCALTLLIVIIIPGDTLPADAVDPTTEPIEPPAPTTTPEPPNPTAEPTISEATAEEALDIILYSEAMAEYADTTATALTNLSELSLQASDDPLLFIDEDWRAEMALWMAMVQVAYEDFVEIEPPDAMAEIHALALDAGKDCNDAMDFLATGLDDLDATAITTASDLMASCGEKMAEATEATNEFVEQAE